MTRNRVRFCIAAVLPVLLAGCAQSYLPFYADQSKVKAPELAGEWQVLKALDDVSDKNVRPWVCREIGDAIYEVQTYDTNGVAATLKVVPFRVGGQLFCDVTAGDIGDKLANNRYWLTSVTPVHTVWKLVLTNDIAVLTGLNVDEVKKASESKVTPLPSTSRSSDERLYTATPQQWEKFLAVCGTNANCFSGDPAYILKRRKAKAD